MSDEPLCVNRNYLLLNNLHASPILWNPVVTLRAVSRGEFYHAVEAVCKGSVRSIIFNTDACSSEVRAVDEQEKAVLEIATAIVGTVITWKLAFPQFDIASQIVLGIILLAIDAVLVIDWSERLYKIHVKKMPRLDVTRFNSADLDAIEKAIKEGFEVEATIGTTVFLVKENY